MDNVERLKKLYEAFDRGDVATVLAAMSPDIIWQEAESNPYRPSGEAFVGPEAILTGVFMRLGADWDGFTIHRNRFHDAGDSIAVEGRYTGTWKATGKRIDVQICHFWDMKNGQLTRFQQYADTAKLQEIMQAG